MRMLFSFALHAFNNVLLKLALHRTRLESVLWRYTLLRHHFLLCGAAQK
jgi:hypothetical protein